MAIYVKGNETKRRMILHTYEKLCDQTADQLTVRTLAKELSCSAAALYRYFDSLEYLIMVSSIRFLDTYMHEYTKLYEQEKEPEAFYIACWKLFDHYAFERPDIYYRLFWGCDNTVFGKALQDYFELFPMEGEDKGTGYQYVLLRTADMQSRDLMMLRRLEKRGLLNHDDAFFLSYANPLIARGLVEAAAAMDEAGRKKQRKLCDYLIEHNTKIQIANHKIMGDSKENALVSHVLKDKE